MYQFAFPVRSEGWIIALAEVFIKNNNGCGLVLIHLQSSVSILININYYLNLKFISS